MTPLVLLPGMMCDARLFGPQVAAFSATRTLVLAPLVGSDSVRGLAEAVLATAPPVFALAGLSMGGIVAMEVVRQAPKRVARLALLDTNPFPDTPEVAARRGPQVARALAGGLAAVMRDEMKPMYLADGPGKAAILDICLDMALGLGPAVFAAQSAALAARPDALDVLGRYRRPALVLMGAEDRLCPHDRHRAMAAAMPQARLVVIEGAGHLPVLERPAETNAALAAWMETEDGS